MARRELAALVVALKEARAARRGAMTDARAACIRGRKLARARIREARVEAIRQLAEQIAREKQDARTACDAAIGAARGLIDRHAQAREKLAAERRFRREMRRLEGYQRQRRRELSKGRKAIHAIQQSDDEVVSNIEPELVPLWNRVKRGIKGTTRKSRTEAFLEYAQANPGEILEAMGDVEDRLVRELEAKEREARRRARAPLARARKRKAEPVLDDLGDAFEPPGPSAAAGGDDVPF
jgi:hypothetical protein